MIRASISPETNILTLAVVGEDIERIKSLPSTLNVESQGLSTNFKTGRKHFVVKFVEGETENISEELDKLKKQLAAEKRKVTKLKNELEEVTKQSQDAEEEQES